MYALEWPPGIESSAQVSPLSQRASSVLSPAAVCLRAVTSTGQLVRDDTEPGQPCSTENGGERHVGGISTARHHDSTDARGVVTGIECIPLAAQVGLEPCTEVHGLRRRRHSDIAQVSRAVARRDVHAAAQSYGEMRE